LRRRTAVGQAHGDVELCADRQGCRQRRLAHARLRAQAVEQRLREALHRRVVGIQRSGRIEAERDDTARVEAEIDARELPQRMREQRRRGEQQRRQRCLRNDEQAAKALCGDARAHARARGEFARRRTAASAPDAERRGEHGDRECRGEGQHDRVHTDRHRLRIEPTGGQPCACDVQRARGERKSAERAESADEQAFAERRQRELRGRSAERGTHRAIVAARERAAA
jgi:hypothetical protein